MPETMGTYLTLLDDFNRANEDPLAGIWTTKVHSADDIPRISSNTVINDATDTRASAWINGTDYGPDVEVALEVVDIPPGSRYIEVYGRLQGAGGSATWDAYVARWNATFSGTDSLELYRVDNNVHTTLGTLAHEGVETVGNQVGLRCIGTSIEAWTKIGAGAWTQRIVVADSTYALTGKVGFGFNRSSGNVTGVDNFKAGTIPSDFFPKTVVVL